MSQELSHSGDSNTEPELTAQEQKQLPLLPLRDVVVLPHMVVPLFVGGQSKLLRIEEFIHMDKKQFGQITKRSRCVFRTGSIRRGLPNVLTRQKPLISILEYRITRSARQRDAR